MNGRSWVGKKGRTLKDNVCTGVKHHPYAYSDMITELNSITSLFIEKQKHMAESTGFKLFAKPLHPLLFDEQFQVWLMPKVDTMGRTIAANGGKFVSLFDRHHPATAISDSKSDLPRVHVEKFVSLFDGLESLPCLRLEDALLAPSRRFTQCLLNCAIVTGAWQAWSGRQPTS
jgi:hypothetical protein